MTICVPPPTAYVFQGNINHPDLYLWDSWSYIESGIIHLYCLAISRTKDDGSRLLESQRNDHPFHVRHFTSKDNATTWVDQGVFLQPMQSQCGHDARTIWSGSVALMPDGEKLVAYTGVYQVDTERPFLQNISLASSVDGNCISWRGHSPLSCPRRDRQHIIEKGYYLDNCEVLGHRNGENGGPIMCWRDPFIFIDKKNKIHLFWAAKSSNIKGVIAHCLLTKNGNEYKIDELYPPIELPDGNQFTQAELPKVYFDELNDIYYLLVSTCSRLNEVQPDNEVEKKMRLYKSNALNREWKCATKNRSHISGTEDLFGMTILETDFKNDRAYCISPHTETGDPSTSLTISAPFYLNFSSNRIYNLS